MSDFVEENTCRPIVKLKTQNICVYFLDVNCTVGELKFWHTNKRLDTAPITHHRYIQYQVPNSSRVPSSSILQPLAPKARSYQF